MMRGIAVRHKAYVNICGIDLIRDENGGLLGPRGQCPDTLRRQLRHRKPALDAAGLPRPAGRCRLASVDNYCPKLVEAMCEIAAPARLNPQIVLLLPGTYNSHRLEVQRCARNQSHLK
jgi:uncharacterized circularly permuted ATP-grasp superfamily protein